jgi:hypothetical protein
MRYVMKLHGNLIVASVSSPRELQLRGASQRGLERLDVKVEDPTPLAADTEQRSEDRN